jgi:hypothetical protein
MGGDGFDEKVFATIQRVRDHGRDKWWLHLSRCRSCAQYWMVAQEERIFDEHFLRRLNNVHAGLIVENDRWPTEFLTYEDVLAVGSRLSKPCRFFELLAPSLVFTVEDLIKHRPTITASEVGYLIGLSEHEAAYLMSLPFPAPDALGWDTWQKAIRNSYPEP